MESKLLTYDKLMSIYKSKGFIWQDKAGMMNIGGVRSNDKTPDVFNDFLFAAYKDENGVNNVSVMPGTTDPGTYWLKNPMNPGGCFVLCPGQYPQSHTPGLHRGTTALVQVGCLTGWRDKNKDGIVDEGGETITGADYGVNIHSMGERLTVIYNWSAGCQGASISDILHLVTLVKKQVAAWPECGECIDYTLLKEDDFV